MSGRRLQLPDGDFEVTLNSEEVDFVIDLKNPAIGEVISKKMGELMDEVQEDARTNLEAGLVKWQ